MKNQTFIVSDESLNSYNMVVLTAGIDYVDFARNPVMYYMHDRARGVVGRWENIRTDGEQLLMDAVFDDSTELGRQVKTQVENGFLRCASIGISTPEVEFINGVQTVVKCRLTEVSIVDIPANRSAVKLFDKGGKEVFNLADWAGKTFDPLRKTIIAFLGLADGADDSEIIKALGMSPNRPKMAENEVSRAIRLRLIDEADREQYNALLNADVELFDEVLARKEAKARQQFDVMFIRAAREHRVDAREKSFFEEIAQLCGYSICERVISLMKPPIPIKTLIERSKIESAAGVPPRSEWGLLEWRKYAPEELESNTALYESLMQEAGYSLPLTVETLDYYRKNNPRYLSAHPKEYQRVMAEKKAKKM